MLEAVGIEKRYGDHVVLAGVEVLIRRGEVVALLGPNGAGKSTFVSIVAGVVDPDAGELRIGGRPHGKDRRAIADTVGWAAQDLAVYPTLTVAENLRLFTDLAGLGRRDAAAIVEELAVALQLAGLMGRRVRTLSGGEQQRVHTAMALVHRPSLLLLDEPTAGVDIGTRQHLLEFVRKVADDGAAVCYSTHYLHEVEELHAQVAIIDRGRIVLQGHVDALVNDHGTQAVELVFDGAPPPDCAHLGHVEGDVLRVVDVEPGSAIAAVMNALGPRASGLVSVNVIRPNLESVFIGITGRQPAATDAGRTQETVHAS